MKKYVISYFLIIIIACVLGTIVCKIPTKYAQKNIIESVGVFEEEWTDPLAKFGYNAVKDNFSDAIMFNIIYSVDSEKPFLSFIHCKNQIIPDNVTDLGNSVKSLIALTKGEFTYIYNYSRYWHGYIIFVKCLLLFFSYNTIRIILNSIIIIIGIIMLYLIMKKIGKIEGLITMLVLISISYQVVGLSIQYFSVFAISVILSIYFLIKSNSKLNIYLIFFIIRWNHKCF